MRIACPSCHATYEVPDTLLRAGPRQVRCAKCATEWLAAPEPAASAGDPHPRLGALDGPAGASPGSPETATANFEADLPPPPPIMQHPAPAAMTEPPLAADRRPPQAATEATRAGPVLIVAWVASLLLLVGLGWAGYAARSDIMAAWPPSARLYQALGLVL